MTIKALVASVGLVLLIPCRAPAQGGMFNETEKRWIAQVLAPLAQIDAKKKEIVRERALKYAADLKSLEIEVARSGDLEAVKRLRAEREAWEKNEPTAAFDAGGKLALARVAALRSQLDEGLRILDGQAREAIEREQAKAVTALNLLKTELTRAGRIDAALKMDEQVEALRAGTIAGPSADGANIAASAPAPTPRQVGATATNPAAAAKSRPFVNSLGMEFVPVPKTKVLFSVFETRVREFQAFVTESGYAWNEKPGFDQTPDDPVVRVSWDDAKAFCAWLSKKEGREYRLPTDDEWSAAVGSDKHPWGDRWPPPADAGNFPGEESKLGQVDDPQPQWMTPGWKDAHPRTAPVGSYRENRLGLHDLAGNVREWCEDWYDAAILKKRRAAGMGDPTGDELADIQKGNARRVVRGGSWDYGSVYGLRSAFRYGLPADVRDNYDGFRCVVVCSASSL